MAKNNFHIPGYKGYIPGDKPENDNLGLTFTNLTRRAFTKERLDDKVNAFASTGFNAKKIPRQDATFQAVNNRFGKMTLPISHPCVWDTKQTTTFRETFGNPRFKQRLNLRQKNCYMDRVDFDNSLKLPKHGSGAITESGFATAMNFFDGSTW